VDVGGACEGSGWTWAAGGGGVDEGGALVVLGLVVLGLEVGAEFVGMEEVNGYWRRAVEAAVRATLEDEEPILVVAVSDIRRKLCYVVNHQNQ
jgi:hypothetical protein